MVLLKGSQDAKTPETVATPEAEAETPGLGAIEQPPPAQEPIVHITPSDSDSDHYPPFEETMPTTEPIIAPTNLPNAKTTSNTSFSVKTRTAPDIAPPSDGSSSSPAHSSPESEKPQNPADKS